MSADITVRRATEADLDTIVGVASASLGWQAGEPHGELFRWKHLDNPFGASPMWVAESGGATAGFRAFMRWELHDAHGASLSAVRAVDTATHPDFQRRGVFSKLTTHALEEVAADGVDIVFNTPNAQSRPGYLKMGWIDVGRLPVAFRPTSPRSLPKLAKARTAADKWSEQSPTGVAASDVTSDPALAELLGSQPAPRGLATPLSVELLRWRYRLAPLHYRAWVPDQISGGVVFFRVRKRGTARECSVALVLSPGGDQGTTRQLLSGLVSAVDADYLLRMGSPDLRGGFVPAPGIGPRLTARTVTSEPDGDISHWHLHLGDVELF